MSHSIDTGGCADCTRDRLEKAVIFVMCDIVVKVGLIVFFLIIILASEVVAYFGGGYVVKAWRIGYIVEPHSKHEQSTPRELRHFWDFNKDDAIVAVTAWTLFLAFCTLVIFIAYAGVTIITHGVMFTIDRLCITPLLGCICGDDSSRGRGRFRMRRVSDVDGQEMYDMEEV